MLHYRLGEKSDPFFFIFSHPGWLREYDPPRDFPFWVNLELTNVCQLDCIFCSRQLSTRPLGYLDEDVFTRVLTEVQDHPPTALRLTGWGEPMLHPRFVEYVQRIKRAGLAVKIYTNGLALTPEIMTGLARAGLDELQFSMQGLTPAQYEFNRRKAVFADFRKKVEMAAEIRESQGTGRPFLSLLTSVLASELQEADPRSFIASWAPLLDKVAVDLTNLSFVGHLDRVRNLLPDQALSLVHRPCVDVFLAIEAKYDGAIEFCGQDAANTPEHVLGNILEMRLHQAWHSERMAAHRQAVGREARHDELPVCRNCYHNTSKYDLFKDKY